MYDDDDVTLIATNNSIKTKNLNHNSEWTVVNTTVKTHQMNFSNPYTSLRYYITLRRRVSFNTCALLIPCVLLWLLTMLVFVIPPQSGEKLALGKFCNSKAHLLL